MRRITNKSCSSFVALALAGLVAAIPGGATAAGKFRLEEATIDGIHTAIKSGEITCKGLVQAYIDRAKAYNGMCTRLVTADGAPIPAAKGAIRTGLPLKFPTKTTAASTFLPNLNE